jgi:hypothetical protein
MLFLAFCAHVTAARKAYHGAEYTTEPGAGYKQAASHFNTAADIAQELGDEGYADELLDKADAAFEMSFF